MISPEEIKAAYDEMIEAAMTVHESEEDRIEKAEERETAYQDAANEARVDGVVDEGKVHNKALKRTRSELTALHVAEKTSRKAKNALQIAGMKVDSLIRQQEAYKMASQK